MERCQLPVSRPSRRKGAIMENGDVVQKSFISSQAAALGAKVGGGGLTSTSAAVLPSPGVGEGAMVATQPLDPPRAWPCNGHASVCPAVKRPASPVLKVWEPSGGKRRSDGHHRCRIRPAR